MNPNYLQVVLFFKKTNKKNIRCSGLCPFVPLVRSAKSLVRSSDGKFHEGLLESCKKVVRKL